MISEDDSVSKGAQLVELFLRAGGRQKWPLEVKADCREALFGPDAMAALVGTD